MRNGYHLWSERYDRKLEDVFAIQDEIAESVARSLELVIGGHVEARRRAKQTDVEAYEFYLRGRQLLFSLTARSVRQSSEMFAKAVEIDPNYALAHAGMADAASWLVMWLAGGDADLRQADESSRRALELAPDLAESHASRGLALMLRRDYDEAEEHFRRAIGVEPYVIRGAVLFRTGLFATGHYEEALAMMRRASEIRVDDYQTCGIVSLIHRKLGRTDASLAATTECLRRIERTLEINPRDVRALYHGGYRLLELGRRDEGVEWVERSLAMDPEDPVVLYNAACFYTRAGDYDRALDRLEEMTGHRGVGGAGNRDWMTNDPDLDPLRDLPRFKDILPVWLDYS